MIRCSGKKEDGTPCDFTSEKKFLFCPECGSESATENAVVRVIKCPGKKVPCGATLSSDTKYKFCAICGWKINRSLFVNPSSKCPGTNEDGTACEEEVTEGEKFCSNCGYEFSPGDEESRLGSDEGIYKDKNAHKTPQEEMKGDLNTIKQCLPQNINSDGTQKSVAGKFDHISGTSVEEKDGKAEESSLKKDDSRKAPDENNQLEKTDTEPPLKTNTVSGDTDLADRNENGRESSQLQNAPQDNSTVKNDTTIKLESSSTSDEDSQHNTCPPGEDMMENVVSIDSEISLKHHASLPDPDSKARSDSTTPASSGGAKDGVSIFDQTKRNGHSDHTSPEQHVHKDNRNPPLVPSTNKDNTESIADKDNTDSPSVPRKDKDDTTSTSAEGTDERTQQNQSGPSSTSEEDPKTSVPDDGEEEDGTEDSDSSSNDDMEDKVGRSVDKKSGNTSSPSNVNSQLPSSSKPKQEKGETQPQGTEKSYNSDLLNDDGKVNQAGASQKNSPNQEKNNDKTSLGKKKGKKRGKSRKKQKKKETELLDTKNQQVCTNSETGDDVDVIFHAVISEEFKVKPETDDVFIVFGHDHLGGWKSWHKWRMELVRKVDNLLQYSCCVRMPKRVRNIGFDYKYVVATKRDKKPKWEVVHFLQRGHRKNSNPNRYFSYPQRAAGSVETWNQYDGFVYLEVTQSWRKSLADFFKGGIQLKLREDVKKAAKMFLPSASIVGTILRNMTPDESERAEKLVSKVVDVLSGLFQQMLDKDMNMLDYSLKAEILSEYVVILVNHLNIPMQNTGKQRYDEKKLNLQTPLLGVFVMMLFSENNIYPAFPLEKRHWNIFLPKPDEEKKECSGLICVHRHFPVKSKSLVDVVEDWIRKHSTCFTDRDQYRVDSSWLYAVPLLHFLRKDSVPFKKMLSPNHNEDGWWGHNKLVCQKSRLKDNDLWTVPVEEIIQDLEYLFDVDYLLPRTIMACVSLNKLMTAVSLQKVPAVVCSATLSYYCGYWHYMDTKLNLANCIKQVTKKFQQELIERNKSHPSRCSVEECFQERAFGMIISFEVVHACLKDPSQCVEMIHAATELFASSIFECPVHEEELSNTQEKKAHEEQRDNLREVVEECWKMINTWMECRFLMGKHYHECLQCWTLLVNVDFGSGNLSDEWKTVLMDAVENVLSKMSADQCFAMFHKENIYGFHKDLQERMMMAAFKSFERLIIRDGKVLNIQVDKKYGQLMTQLLESHWPANHDEEGLIEHVLTWKALSLYFKHYTSDESIRNWLSLTCADHLQKAKDLLHGLRNFLLEGDIPLKLLSLILEHKTHFLEILQSSGCCNETEIPTVQLVLEARKRELEAFNRNLKYASILLNMAVHMNNVDTNQLAERIHQMEKSSEYEILTNICNPLPKESATAEYLRGYQPSNCIEGIGERTLEIVPKLERLRESMIFKEMWRKQCHSVQQGTSFEEAVKLVWQKTTKTWTVLSQRISTGDETFSTVRKHVDILCKDFEGIKREFTLMFGECTSDLVDERVEQLQIYEKLQGCQKASKIILEMKDMYCLTGNFLPVAAIQDLVKNETLPMKKLDKSVINTCDILEGLDDHNKQKCIKAFKDSKPLVKWVQTSMKDMKEVKVFVDLAFISAGEEPDEIEKVNCFHAAVTGYAPLIFNTPPDCDYGTFLENCKLTWRELASDKNLYLKLDDANRHLHWLKEVKESHGSVEVTSLTQADMINTRGCYRIGNLNDLQNFSDLALINVISLDVPPDTETSTNQGEKPPNCSSARKYTHDQLVDLQSRLMLVAGKAEMGKENVDQFVMVLDGVVRLAKTFIRLCSDGCVLFNCWNGQFFCGKERKACAILEFGLEDSETLKGHQGRENVDKFVIALANQFEEFHDEWLKYASDKRDEYLELNFYTIDQLVFLQRELIKLGTEEEPSVRVYPMLSLIKPNCTQADLTHAMQMAEDTVFGREGVKKHEMEVVDTLENDDPKQGFIDAMLNAGFQEWLAKKAITEVDDPQDIDSGIVWCLEHQEDEFEEPMDTGPTFSGWQVKKVSMSISAAAYVKAIADGNRCDKTVENLKKNLKSVWTKFLGDVSSSVADYLSLEHLGIILRQLARAEENTFGRTIPPPLEPGIPNLIVCPQVDMLNAVMYIYKHSDDQPLPQPDEVLLCTPQTTFDQVHIFLRRAFFSKPGKAFTLANADLLLYEIQERTEMKLKEYARKSQTYQLVILCSTENEFKARIVAALERNRCPPPSLQNLEEIKQYLRTKFSQDNDTEEIQTASQLDFECSTVRVVKSTRAGVGKTLYKRRQVEALQRLNPRIPATSVTIHLYKKTVSTADVAEKLLDHTLPQGNILPRILHLDISYEVQEGVDYLLFNLLVLGCISNNMGHVWLRSPLDLYLVETIPITDARHERKNIYSQQVGQRLIHPLLEVLPDVYCWSPQDSLQILTTTDNRPKEYAENDRLFDETEFRSEVFQRPFQYLKRWSTKANLTDVHPARPEGTHEECLSVLLRHCGVKDPAWSELHNFVWFLNTQLEDFEKSVFCADVILEDLPGFPALVLKFLIQMSRDFATRSLEMSEETPHHHLDVQETEDEDLAQFQLKRTWESSRHPYIFFNPDGQTMTFLDFNIDRHTGNMVDQQTEEILEAGVVSRRLQDGLKRNRVNINENIDQMPRHKRLEKLCSVMPGAEFAHDPDPTYELTTDNVKKILAIYMRFRCGIPVIIMGETGCGKTRLVKFMCALQCPPGSDIENMVIMKVHGGTTSEDIIRKVQHAEKLAATNKAENKHMYTVLFFDEANTTESIGLIKEIMCDGAMDGQPLRLSENLKIVAACNPYRKHSDELIQRLEKAGLGYHVDADKTTDKLGRVPMRRLVYRVQPLPQSMLPLVWDFGQLNTDVEKMYIKQMVNRYIRKSDLPSLDNLDETVSQILQASQEFMRELRDECSFVSLRDVERTLSVMAWFYGQSQKHGTLFDMIDERLTQDVDPEEEEFEEEYCSEDDSDEDEEDNVQQLAFLDAEEIIVEENAWPSNVTKALILALSVCYRASLRSRDEFDNHIIKYFDGPCTVPGGKKQMIQVIDSCQSVFVDQVQLEDNIAKNLALKENLFMMVVCIELRIPLFLVGKPGSSKSLAKTIVADAMQGNSARTDLFKQLKQAQMVSFQCSPLATAEGIVGTFRQCARYQQDKDLDRFVSIVVLDEVGLAEDSPRMPLKTLHPLLEDGCQGDEEPKPSMKVAFIGISNWALDPAKMNRGILVQREAPDEGELVESAKGICSSSKKVLHKIEVLLPKLATAYETIFSQSQEARREFFGLRDYYSLVKMVYAFAASQERDVCWHQLVHAIKRNFGGLDKLDPVAIFKENISGVLQDEEEHEHDPDSSTTSLIEAGLFGDGTSSESRYLLLLTENYGALRILQQQILAKHNVITIFGSSFPKDQEYTQICRNINRIKVCMETGSTVILLNLENLYESLYDALNQYYARLGGERFVDLGLGTHRVKCRVHKEFRLIVVAEKQIVYDKFPIPLINRLEKHFLTLDNMMTPEQIQMAEQLQHWAQEFVTPFSHSAQERGNKMKEVPEDAFIGFHADTAAAIVLKVWGRRDRPRASLKPLFDECKETLLWCASPQYIVRLPEQRLHTDADRLQEIYIKHQKHDDIIQYLQWKLKEDQHCLQQAQITTHSKLLTDQEKEDVARNLNLTPNNIILLTLQSFDTEQQFAQQIKTFVQRSAGGQRLLLIQCGSGDRNQSLIRSAQFCVLDELPDEGLFAVVFIIQLPNIAGGCFSGFQTGKWHSLHLDELRPQPEENPTMEQLYHNSPAAILKRVISCRPTGAQRKFANSSAMETSFMSIEEGPEVIYQRTVNVGEGMTEDQAVAPFIRQLLLPCIQSAAALIKDDESDSRRSTKRIEMLLRLIGNKDDEDAQVFIQSLSHLIISLLYEKEQALSGGTLHKNWLFKEATQNEKVQQAGTFRRAWIQHLEKNITPVMAGVIAFIDTNRNMDFMCESGKAPWTKKLWLEIIKNTQLCFDHCKDHILGQKQYHQGKIIPHHFVVGGSVSDIKTPFFWLLYQAVDNAITQARETEEGETKDAEEGLKYLESIINKTPYGEVLVSVVGEEDLEDFISAYLEDFISMVYPGMMETWKILCDSLMSAARQKKRDLFSLNLIQALIYIHIIHSEAKERLHLFLEVEQVWPDVVQAVTELKSSVAGNPLLTADEMTLDVLSVVLLLKQLEPNKEQLNTDDGRAKWMDKVKAYLPVIERILNTTETDLTHGPVCCGSLDRARCGRVRVVTLKLFLESFMSNKKHKVEARCMALWMMLDESADLTKMPSLTKVEKFLKTVSSAEEKKLSGKRGKCSHCETEFGEALGTQLPCKHKHRICLRCLNDLQLQAGGNRRCPVCHTNIPKTFRPGSSSPHQREVLEEYRAYQKCCNNFLMSVVSKLCFGGIRTPDSAVIERIFSYITRRLDKGQTLRTKDMSIFDDAIDPTPVVRSFLLQLLIHKSETAVTEYLQDFFLQARDLCQQGGEETTQATIEEIVQFSLLVIHCYEDLYHERVSGLADPSEEMNTASQYLAEGRKLIVKLGIDMPKMLAIAQCRFGLSVATTYLNAALFQKSLHRSREFQKLMYEVQNLLNIEETEWPKKFLVKQICKEFGTDSFQAICSTKMAPWLAVETTHEVRECPDRYVLCLTNYNQLREAVAKVLLGENTKHFKNILEGDELLFMLAVHREVTVKNVKPHSEADTQLQNNSQQGLKDFINKSQERIVQKELALKLLRNEFGREGSYLNIKPYQSLRDQSLVCLLFHTYLVLTHYNNKPGFLKPLADLITQPADMTDMLLPTMPQDDTDSIRQTMLAALKDHNQTGDNTVVFFCCPNGHPYAITECGRPYTEGKCHTCGLKIGGHRHQAFPGNFAHSGTDQTRQGHILGTAAERTNNFASERDLGGAACAVLRFFTHAALMLGTEANPQAVAGLVYPALQQDVGQFFWDHLQKDLEIIHLATGKSVDDVFLLLHFICHQITQLGKFKESDDRVLDNKKARQKWENEFATVFVNKPLKDMDNCLSTCNDMILRDQRIGQDALMSILYEVDKTTPTQVECLHEFPVVWRYRSRITLEHFLREFILQVENSKNRKPPLAILSLFRQEHPYLQALHHIPNILRLQQFLMAKYRRRLDRGQANNMTIAQMLSMQDHKCRDDIVKLLPDFIAAWESVKESLHSAGCLTVQDGIIRLPDAYKNMVIDENSPLAVLLPSTQGPGICSYMLLEFLFRKHNEFMEKYCQKTRTKYDRLPEVSVRKLHSNHLINYHPERDLLPIVLANCNYSFELGKGTKIEYDFEGFEYQLQETILQSKSRVEQKSHVIPIDTMMYRADAGNAVMFETLRGKIPQESLAPAVRLQISRELKTCLPDICDSISNLNITISFLKSLGGRRDQSLHKFMLDALKMKQTVTSQKAQQFCQFKHVQSLWLLLNFEKSVVLADQFKQDPFTGLDSDQREELDEEMRGELEQFCQNKSLDKLEYLLQQMFDCLLLRVAQPADPFDEEAVDMRTRSLGHILIGHLEAPLYNSEKDVPEYADQILSVDELGSFPANILGKHIPDSWLMVLKEVKQRKKETIV